MSLPGDASLLSVEIGGQAVRSVRPEASPDGSDRRFWTVPLPQRSYVRLNLSYERSGNSDPGLASWGTWDESGPIFEGFPVDSTVWEVHHPSDYRFYIEGESNLLPEDPSKELRIRTFAESFFGHLMSAELPLFTAAQFQYQERPPVSRQSAGTRIQSAAGAQRQGALRPQRTQKQNPNGVDSTPGERHRGSSASGHEARWHAPIVPQLPKTLLVEPDQARGPHRGGRSRIVGSFSIVVGVSFTKSPSRHYSLARWFR